MLTDLDINTTKALIKNLVNHCVDLPPTHAVRNLALTLEAFFNKRVETAQVMKMLDAASVPQVGDLYRYHDLDGTFEVVEVRQLTPRVKLRGVDSPQTIRYPELADLSNSCLWLPIREIPEATAAAPVVPVRTYPLVTHHVKS